MTNKFMDQCTAAYLLHPDAASDVRASPLLADDHAGLPRTHIVTAGFDPLLDEGAA